MRELAVQTEEKEFLSKRLKELKSTFSNLKNDALVVSLKQYTEVKVAIPLLDKALKSTEGVINSTKERIGLYKKAIDENLKAAEKIKKEMKGFGSVFKIDSRRD